MPPWLDPKFDEEFSFVFTCATGAACIPPNGQARANVCMDDCTSEARYIGVGQGNPETKQEARDAERAIPNVPGA